MIRGFVSARRCPAGPAGNARAGAGGLGLTLGQCRHRVAHLDSTSLFRTGDETRSHCSPASVAAHGAA